MKMILTGYSAEYGLTSPVAWTHIIDPNKYTPAQPVSMYVGSAAYNTVIEALADGWELLGPPTDVSTARSNRYEWWLTKTKE